MPQNSREPQYPANFEPCNGDGCKNVIKTNPIIYTITKNYFSKPFNFIILNIWFCDMVNFQSILEILLFINHLPAEIQIFESRIVHQIFR